MNNVTFDNAGVALLVSVVTEWLMETVVKPMIARYAPNATAAAIASIASLIGVALMSIIMYTQTGALDFGAVGLAVLAGSGSNMVHSGKGIAQRLAKG